MHGTIAFQSTSSFLCSTMDLRCKFHFLAATYPIAKLVVVGLMDLTNIATWVTTVVVIFITAIVTKIIVTGRRTTFQEVCSRAHPPVVNGPSLIKLVHVVLTKGLREMIRVQYRALGSVFTISFFGVKITFLVGPEVLDHFYQGLESEISHGNTLEFMVPMLGKEVGFGVDVATRNEQMRFHNDALKLSKLRSHTDPMLQEVEVSIPS